MNCKYVESGDFSVWKISPWTESNTLGVQAVCDSNLKFLDIVARWPGSSHDATIFNASRVRARFINGELGDALLLGDSGYACSNFLLTPLLETHN